MPAFPGRQNAYQDNLTALGPPTAASDINAGYGLGSTWFDTTNGVLWQCMVNTAGAAIWKPVSSGIMFSLIGANMNVTTDQQLNAHIPSASRYYITRILITNASISLTTAAGGFYTAAGKGGTTLVASSQVYTQLTGANLALAATLASGATNNTFTGAPYVSLSTAQGAAATADIYVTGDLIPHA
jgi:hypothetical protein